MRSNFPLTKIEYSYDTEVFRLLFTALYIKNGFYSKKGFYVLPYPMDNSIRSIHFPRLDFWENKEFWQKLSPDLKSFVNTEKELLKEMKIELEQKLNLENINKIEVLNDWLEVQDNFWKISDEVIPGLFTNYKKVVIRPTAFGSISSEFSTETNLVDTLSIYIRTDMTVSHIFEALLMNPINSVSINSKVKGLTWEERENIIDFLLNFTKLKTLSGKFIPTIASIRNLPNNNLEKASLEYQRSLGFGNIELIENKEGEIFFSGNKVKFSPQENSVINLLLNKRHEVVSIDQIADELWGEKADEKFSLAAITKIIERIRKKLKDNCIFPDILETVRGHGYLLND